MEDGEGTWRMGCTSPPASLPNTCPPGIATPCGSGRVLAAARGFFGEDSPAAVPRAPVCSCGRGGGTRRGGCDGISRPGHQTPGCFQITSCLSSGSLLFTVDALKRSRGERPPVRGTLPGWGGRGGSPGVSPPCDGTMGAPRSRRHRAQGDDAPGRMTSPRCGDMGRGGCRMPGVVLSAGGT